MRGLLKFITCGSVDDGKSTLIGHMLYDAKLLFADQKRALELESKVAGAGGVDYSLLLDGLLAEREQKITIDVAYRYFSTKRRSFIVADTPGHEEYTRNMAVGASFADLAVILVDAARGMAAQTRRHARICAFMGIRHVVFVVNKMDLVGYDASRFAQLEEELRCFAATLAFASADCIPVSATAGDNLTALSARMPWYRGKALLTYLEEIDAGNAAEGAGAFLPVQRVARPDAQFRGFQGQLEGGSLAVGDAVRCLPSGEAAEVAWLFWADREVKGARAGDPVTICLDREVDVSRGCVLEKGGAVEASRLLAATLLWLDDEPLLEGKNYWLKLGTKLTPATVLKLRYKAEEDGGRSAARAAYKNEFVSCELALAEETAFTSFAAHKALGALLLIDRVTHATAACGKVEHALRRSDTVRAQPLDVTRAVRAAQKGQKPLTLWFTGLSGAGKSTLANALEKRLVALGRHTMLLDGDNVRLGLSRDLGFKEQDRIENIRRTAEVARLMNDAGLVVLTAFISPYARDREEARRIVGEAFVEVYVSAPLAACEARDVKGLYRRARAGEIPNFTGVSGPYEAPLSPEVSIDTSRHSLEACVELLLKALERYGL